MDRPATMINISRRQPWRSASSSIRPSRGSTGMAASRRPTLVSRGLVPRSPVGERTELGQQPQAVGDLGAVRWLQEREGGDVAQLGRRHLQDHRREVGAQDLRLGELRAARRSPPRCRAGCTPPARPGRSARPADRRKPGRSARSAAAAPWSGPSSGRSGPCRRRRRSGCRARSARSPRRWWPARPGGPGAARTPGAARPPRAGRTAAAPRWRAASARRSPPRRPGSLARRSRKTKMSPPPRPLSSRTASTMPPTWSASPSVSSGR